jgi:TIR domain
VSSKEHTVFIAYARNDLAEVTKLARRLRKQGIKTLTDTEDLSIGDEWEGRLRDFIDTADTIIFIISPSAMTSRWCLWEVEYAASQNKRILPILLKPVKDDIIPPTLARLQYLVLTDPDDDRTYATLIDAIHAGAKYGHGAKGDSVFVSYRRNESGHVAGRIYDHFEREFGTGKVFFDVEGIPIGGDFRDHIRAALLKSQALVLVIGRQWTNRFRTSSRWLPWRTTDLVDYVRIEIELALNHNVRIIPLLVDNARMPSEGELPAKIRQICYYQAAPIRAGLDFRTDILRVVVAIKKPPLHATI